MPNYIFFYGSKNKNCAPDITFGKSALPGQINAYCIVFKISQYVSLRRRTNKHSARSLCVLFLFSRRIFQYACVTRHVVFRKRSQRSIDRRNKCKQLDTGRRYRGLFLEGLGTRKHHYSKSIYWD